MCARLQSISQMLKRIESPSIETAEQLRAVLPDTLCAAHTLFSLLIPYNIDSAWLQTANEAVTALVVVKTGQTAHIAAAENADFEELRLFLQTLGGKKIYADAESLQKLGITPISRYSLMESERLEKADCGAVTVVDGFRPIYDLLLQTVPGGTDTIPAQIQEMFYKNWLSQTVRGVFGGYTVVKAIYANDGRIIASAVADFFGDLVYIRDVVTDKAYRRQGFGRACVHSLCSELKTGGNRVFLLCEDNQNENFYKKSGFVCKAQIELGIVSL